MGAKVAAPAGRRAPRRSCAPGLRHRSRQSSGPAASGSRSAPRRSLLPMGVSGQRQAIPHLAPLAASSGEMANAWRPYADMVRTALPLHDAGNYPAVEPRSHREVARPRGPIIPAKLPEITRDPALLHHHRGSTGDCSDRNRVSQYFGVGSLQWQIRNVSRSPLPDDRPFRAPPHEADDDIPFPASVAWSPRVVLPPQPEPSDGSSQRWSEMNNFKGTSFDDRLSTAANAKKAELEKFRARSGTTDPAV